jgi:hypothetical protein
MNLTMFKTIGKVMIFIVCTCAACQLASQWVYQTPQSNHKVGVQDNLILDENTVWMGANEFLWDTTINNWNYGQAACFYHVSDGVNWISGKFEIEPNRYPYVSSIASSGSNTSWASIYGVADGTNTVFKTIDNGHNWSLAANTKAIL